MPNFQLVDIVELNPSLISLLKYWKGEVQQKLNGKWI